MAPGKWLLLCAVALSLPSAAHAKKRRPTDVTATVAGAAAAAKPAPPPPDLELVMPPPANPNDTVRMPEPAVSAPSQKAGAPPLPRWMVGARVGTLFPQVVGRLTTSPTGGVEAGYLLSEHFQLALDFDYAEPRTSLSGSNAAVGSYRITTVARQYQITAGVLGRLLPLASSYNFFLQLGPTLLVQNLQEQGSASGGSIGTTSLTSVQVGGAAALGAELTVGPGQLMLQGAFIYVPLAKSPISSGVGGGLGVQSGYRIRF